MHNSRATPGLAIQRDFENLAERGPRAIDPGKEFVRWRTNCRNLSQESQRKAARQASPGRTRVLGLNGSAIVHDVLIHGRTMEQIAISRDMSGERATRYLSKRFHECLDDLAQLYGYAMTGT